jgi:hypothetical protein
MFKLSNHETPTLTDIKQNVTHGNITAPLPFYVLRT